MEEIIEIKKSDFDKIVHSMKKLIALEACGVDNWDGYDDAMEMLDSFDWSLD